MESGQPSAKAKPKSKATAKPKKQLNPLVYAATVRAKTTKLCVDVENQLLKACRVADNILNKVAPEMCEVDADNDGTLDLLRSRRELVEVAMSPPQPQDQMAMANLRLFQLCINDPYLKDCRATILANEEACQSLGYIKHSRKVTLDLQSCVEKIDELMGNQRNALELLSRIAECLLKEAESWQSNVQALVKAKQTESKALKAAEEKNRKAEEKAQERRRKKEALLAAKKAKEDAAAEAPEGDHAAAEATNVGAKSKRRRCNGEIEVTEEDYKLIQALPRLAYGAMTTVQEVSQFVANIVENPHLGCIAKLRRGSFKKVLAAHDLSATECN